MKAYRGTKAWFHLFLSFTLDGVIDKIYVPSILFLRKNSRYPFNRMLDGNRVLSGRITEQQNRLILPGFETPDRPSSSPATITDHKAPFLKKITVFVLLTVVDYLILLYNYLLSSYWQQTFMFLLAARSFSTFIRLI